MHFRSRQSDFLVLMFFAKCFPHLTHRGTVCAVPRFFSLGHFVTKLRPSALASGRRQRAQHATTSGNLSRSRRVWGGSPTSVFAALRDAKIASVATLALLAVSERPRKCHNQEMPVTTKLPIFLAWSIMI